MATSPEIDKATALAVLNERQLEGLKLAKKDEHHFILYAGGSRSGKSVLITFIMVMRAMLAPGTNHAVFRDTQVNCHRALFNETVPWVIREFFPELPNQPGYSVNKSEHTITLPGGSKIHFGGLDDPEKLLGMEYATIWCNEVTSIKWSDVKILMNRLNQDGDAVSQRRDGTVVKRRLVSKMFFDCNPQSKKSWEYRSFVDKVNPDSGKPRTDAKHWVWMQINSEANLKNLSPDYMARLEANYDSPADRKRFIDGYWGGENPNALFTQENINEHRTQAPDSFKRIVVAVDPAITANERSDETGIIVVGIDYDGHAWVLEDLSGIYKPHEWAQKTADAFERWQADAVVAEKNQGGDMVEYTLRTKHRYLPVKLVHASRGKDVRAEPIAAAYRHGDVSHAVKVKDPDHFDKLEEQMTEFNPQDKKAKSPDRMDALVWGLTELFGLGKRGGNGGPSIARRLNGFF